MMLLRRMRWLLLLLALPIYSQAGPPLPSAAEIMTKVESAIFLGGAGTFTVSVRDIQTGSAPRETRYSVKFMRSGDENLSMVDTVFPERQKGRKLLTRNNDLWIYLPTVKRPTRVSFREKLTGEVSNGDIAKTDYKSDYEPKILGTATTGGKQAIKLLLTGKHKEVTYQKIVLWVEQGKYLPIQAEFYALSGKLLKVGEYKGYKNVLGKTMMTELIIKDAIQRTRQSHLIYTAHRREQHEESQFTKESMSN